VDHRERDDTLHGQRRKGETVYQAQKPAIQHDVDGRGPSTTACRWAGGGTLDSVLLAANPQDAGHRALPEVAGVGDESGHLEGV
ncbi:hypothetical protein OSK85_25215, partial [Escherichia coli]|nr:hypothetical protein [Escherichia coli]